MFTFTPEICPAGYVLTHRYEDSDVNHICDCNEENNPQIIQCENERIILRVRSSNDSSCMFMFNVVTRVKPFYSGV